MLEVQGQDKREHAHSENTICQEVNRRVYAFIEGQMDIGQLQEFREHIGQCLSCQTMVQFEKKLIQVIRIKGGQSVTDIPTSLKEKIKKVFDDQSGTSEKH